MDVVGNNIPNPILTFNQLGLKDTALKNCGYSEPNCIQKYIMPCVASGRDMLVVAQVEQKKYWAFMASILEKIATTSNDSNDQLPGSPQCIIVLPTRASAVATLEETTKLMDNIACKVALACSKGSMESVNGSNLVVT